VINGNHVILHKYVFTAIPITVWRPIGLWDDKNPKFLDIWLTCGGKVVSPMHWPWSTLEKHYLSASGTYLC
jgi:hypothetical protein